MRQKIAIHWFRQDLRLDDNPSLTAASHDADKILPIYILDDDNSGNYAMGAASRVWLYHSLKALNQSLGECLSVYKGNPIDILHRLINAHNVTEIHWNRCYEPWRMKRDEAIKSALKERGVRVESHNGSLLWEPWTICKNDGTPYKVFTPFYRKGCLAASPPHSPLRPPELASIVKPCDDKIAIDNLGLLPRIRWDKTMIGHWTIGETGAQQCLTDFITHGIQNYKEGRDIPAQKYVSRLSPYLHFGEISPHRVWHAITGLGDNKNTDHFCSELGWREFSYNLLYHNNDLPHSNLQTRFDAFPWDDNPQVLDAWQQGQTGIPMVDAGMRELWQTGYMHNRVRMIVGSFLVKNLLTDWRHGERWFWDCLFDADLANNSASWQWIAGCGADAAPYFRIFNPVTQGQKFDPQGAYVRRFIPELQDMPDKYIHAPWEAPPSVLDAAKVLLGHTYPRPIVDLAESRARALAAFQSLKAI